MNQQDLAQFNQAINLAQSGQKQTAYNLLSQLAKQGDNSQDSNLMLWLVFTSPNLVEAAQTLDYATRRDPNNPSLTAAREWLVTERAKEFNPPAPVMPPPQPIYQQPAPPIAQPVTQRPATWNPQQTQTQLPKTLAGLDLVGLNLPYTIPGVGGLLLFGCAFLPWLSITIFALQISINGLGQVTNASGATLSTTTSPNATDGYIAAILALIILALAVVGFYKTIKYLPEVLIVLGVMGALLMVYDFISAASRVAEVNLSGSANVQASSGPGQFVGLVGALAVVIGGFYIRSRSK